MGRAFSLGGFKKKRTSKPQRVRVPIPTAAIHRRRNHKTEWWQKYPKDLSPRKLTLVIGVDTAFKKTESADYSVAVVAGVDRNGDIYIVDIIRGKYDFLN